MEYLFSKNKLKIVALFDDSEADFIRAAISKKISSQILKYKDIFLKKAIQNNYSNLIANKIFS